MPVLARPRFSGFMRVVALYAFISAARHLLLIFVVIGQESVVAPRSRRAVPLADAAVILVRWRILPAHIPLAELQMRGSSAFIVAFCHRF